MVESDGYKKKAINNGSSINRFKKGYDGHSGGATPGLIPNPEVKSTSVPRGTMVREPMGSWDRRQPLSKELLIELNQIDNFSFFSDGKSIEGSRGINNHKILYQFSFPDPQYHNPSI